VDQQAIRFHQFWLKLRQLGENGVGELAEHNLCAAASKLNRFTRPRGGPGAVLASLRYAFHFDAGLYAGYLRRYAEARGVRRIEGKILEAKLRPGDGFITDLVLQDGRTVPGELFLDCSGWRGLLIAQTLRIGFRDWHRWLPCDRAVTAPCERVAPLLPYTRATADLAGWRWRIPLQHRTGNGYVYCSDFISEVAAQARLLCQLDGPASSDVRLLKFTTGHRWRFWERNCIAIGLAGGFLEPLESTGIHLIQSGISRLLACFPDRSFCPAATNAYNSHMTDQYRRIRDFLILHYKATERRDTPFWEHCREMRIPASLQQRIDLFRASGTVLQDPQDLFTDHSWIAVMLGQGITPASHDPLVDSLPLDKVRQFVRHVAEVTAQTAQAMPHHDAFIQHQCSASRQPAPVGVSDSYC
jgi:tryptophan halogenase